MISQKRISALILLVIFIVAAVAAGCDDGQTVKASSGNTEALVSEDTGITDSGADGPAGQETDGAEISEAPAEEIPETSVQSAEQTEETSPPETEQADDSQIITSGKTINPLTGLPGTKEMMTVRPVAIMINNIKQACPQVGISHADVIYEMMAEGGITRLMMLVTDYASLGVVGSVRSSREYYIDMAQNHDAIYIHAGGANTAYAAIQSRDIDNIDGVNMYTPSTFYRDAARASEMGLEHSLMTTGEGIVSGIKYKNYRTAIKEGFLSPLHFIDYDAEAITLLDGAAKHIIIPYNNYTFPQYIYRPASGVYSRYQFNGKAHIDSETGEILTFTNILVIVCKHTYTGDSYGHIGIDTTGSGDGYYFTMGTYAKIHWSKVSVDEPFTLTYPDGSPLYLNCGKTFINVVDSNVFANITLNYVKK